MLDRVEGDPHAGVADGVDVDLKAVGIERAHRFLQALRRPVRQPACVRSILVGLEQEAGAGLDHTIGEELHGARADPRRRRCIGLEGAARIVEAVTLLGPRQRVGLEGGVDAARQQSPARPIAVHVELVVVDHCVLCPHDPLRAQQPHCLDQSSLPTCPRDRGHVPLHEIHRAVFKEHPDGLAVAVAHDRSERRLRSRPQHAASLERRAVRPQRVVVGGEEHHGSVAARRVEPFGAADTVRQDRRRVAMPDDPRICWVCIGPPPYSLDDLVERGHPGEIELAAVDAGVQRVRVAVAERRHQTSAVEMHDFVERRRPRRCLVADRRDAIAIDGHRRRQRAVEHDDGPTGEQHA